METQTEIKDPVEEMRKKRQISYKINCIEYQFGTCSDEPHLCLSLGDFRFGEGNSSYIGLNIFYISMNKTTFNDVTGQNWNGSEREVQTIKKDLEGKVFVLDLGIK